MANPVGFQLVDEHRQHLALSPIACRGVLKQTWLATPRRRGQEAVDLRTSDSRQRNVSGVVLSSQLHPACGLHVLL